jgi:hypothetical protein
MNGVAFRLRRLDFLGLFLILGVLGMEASWLTPWIPLFDPLLGVESRSHSMLGVYAFFLVVFSCIWVVRQTQLSAVAQAAVITLLVVVTTLGFVRAELYSSTPLFSTVWVVEVISSLLSFPQRVPPEAFLLLVSFYVWHRCIVINEASMATDLVAGRFRWGFLALALYAYVALLNQVTMPWELFTFFTLGMVSIASARLLESDVRIRSWSLARRWIGLLLGSAVLTLSVGLAALFFLSPGNLIRAGEVLAPIFRWIRYLLTYIVMVVAYALQRLISGITSAVDPNVLPSVTTPEMPGFGEPLNEVASPPWLSTTWMVIGRIIVLVVLFLVVGLIVRRIVRRRRARRIESDVERESLGMAREGLKEGLERGWQRMIDALKQLRQTPNYSTENIRRIYASLVAFGGELGHPRGEEETPYEYLGTLEELFDGSELDVDLITDAYVNVHYGEFPEVNDQVERVRESWERLRKATQEDERDG